METHYIKVIINGEEKNLPTKDGKYDVHYSQVGDDSLWLREFNAEQKDHWIEHIDWYLQPLPDTPKRVSDEEILEPIQNAFYATGAFSTDDSTEFAKHILSYLREEGFEVIQKHDFQFESQPVSDKRDEIIAKQDEIIITAADLIEFTGILLSLYPEMKEKYKKGFIKRDKKFNILFDEFASLRAEKKE